LKRRPAGLLQIRALRFHRALVRRKYQWLFSTNARHRPGPKGPSKELIAAILEIKRLNPRLLYGLIDGAGILALGPVFGVDLIGVIGEPQPKARRADLRSESSPRCGG
jgi:hypothetical protein